MFRVLLVDDEPNVLAALRRTLINRQSEFLSCDIELELQCFTDPQQALNDMFDVDVDLIISDYRMPAINGIELLSRFRTIQPDAVRVILSGYADLNGTIAAINEAEIYRFLNKPWEEPTLLTTIRQALHLRILQRENATLRSDLHVSRLRIEQYQAVLRNIDPLHPRLVEPTRLADLPNAH